MVAALTAPAVGSAQGGGSVTPFTAVWVGAGTLLVDVSRLNPHFERNDLPELQRPGYFTLSNDGYTFGGGVYGPITNKLLLGGEIHSGDIGEESSPSGKTNQLSTKYWMGTIGWAGFTGWRFTLQPYLGIGTGTVTLTLKSRAGGSGVASGQSPTFDEVVVNPGAKSVMTGSYVIVQPGVGFDYLALRGDSDHYGVVLGLRLSSALSPNRTTWTFRGQDVFGGPDVGPVGGMFRVIIGVGGFRLGN